MDDAGKLNVKATGKNLSSKDINQITSEGKKALESSDFRASVVKKIDDALTLGDAKSFPSGVENLKK